MKIGKKIISENSKTYFVADIAANHDGSLKRAKKLIRLCAKAGADAAKFQHFKASTIISKDGFNDIGKLSHQSKWKKSVYQIYEDASINFSWTKELKKECKKNNIAKQTISSFYRVDPHEIKLKLAEYDEQRGQNLTQIFQQPKRQCCFCKIL